MILRQAILFFAILFLSCENNIQGTQEESKISKLELNKDQYETSCEWCGANEAPDDISWKTSIADKDEPGERMIISGTVYEKDGQTAAKDVIVYVYHTNAEGKYPKNGDETGNAKRHGYLRGWMKTNEKGQYQFESIRPAAYQSHGGEPAHIHYVIKARGKKEYWLDALIFEGDPRITKETFQNTVRDGGFGITTKLEKGENDILIGKRDIIIGDYN